MNKAITKKEFETADRGMKKILASATKKGGFSKLTSAKTNVLTKNTKVVETYEAVHYNMPMPETIDGLIALKMFERKLKQKDLAKLLDVTDTKLFEILHQKRKPSLSFLKAMHEKLGIDGNLLLRASKVT